ncbi:MAG TPA: hypothetical protein VF503_20220 [Sphingobium sp.]|uniref:hypothetical protein n=1 Tax=Sphingobium sp. TaxID=1912891 RepID=UPI002ED0EEC3
MTKPRAPLTFGLAITTIAGVIGWPEACRITKRANRTLRLWSETDKKGSPTLQQALALDAAYIAAGGERAPILESYALQIEVLLADSIACRLELAGDIAEASREAGEAIAFSIAVAQPGASPGAIHRAIAETEEAAGRFARLLARLKSFLPGNGAVQGLSGELS